MRFWFIALAAKYMILMAYSSGVSLSFLYAVSNRSVYNYS